jgi:hypothetical protein
MDLKTIMAWRYERVAIGSFSGRYQVIFVDL